MMESVTNGSGTLGAQERDEILRRILSRVEKDRGRGKLEVVIAVILSLATLGSTWCGYQARQWGGTQSSNQGAADTAERQAAENTIVGLQMRTQDGLVLLEYWKALRAGDTQMSETIRLHMRPQLQKALQASVDAGILKDPSVAGPLQREEYVLAEEQAAAVQREAAHQHHKAGAAAGKTTGGDVLLTLMVASVLFLGGCGGRFTQRRIRNVLAGVALALFAVTLVMMLGLPVFRE